MNNEYFKETTDPLPVFIHAQNREVSTWNFLKCVENQYSWGERVLTNNSSTPQF